MYFAFLGWCWSYWSQNHRRHLRRLGCSWRWCILRQGLHQSRSISSLCRSLGCQVTGQSWTFEALSRTGVVCHRSGRAVVHYRFWLWHLEQDAKRTNGHCQQKLWFASRQDRKVGWKYFRVLLRLYCMNIICMLWFFFRDLNLRQPIYQSTSCYGHFGRSGFSWENAKDLDLNWLDDAASTTPQDGSASNIGAISATAESDTPAPARIVNVDHVDKKARFS